MTNGQNRAIENVVNIFKQKYPDAKVVVKESGNCFIDGRKVLNFNTIISEYDKKTPDFLKKMIEFYENLNDSGLNLNVDKMYSVIYENKKINLKFLRKKSNGIYIFKEVDTPVYSSSNEVYYFDKKQVKNIFKDYI
jgi:hypothetical protein